MKNVDSGSGTAVGVGSASMCPTAQVS